MVDQTGWKLLAATFDDQVGAGRALATLAPALAGQGLGQAAVVTRDPNGKVRFAETDDRTTGQGAFEGAGIGAMVGLVGLLFGPVGLLGLPVGAAVGALVGKLRDTGFDDDELRAMGADLPAGSSALVATIDPAALDKARRLLAEVDARQVYVHDLDEDLSEALDEQVASALETAEPAPEAEATAPSDGTTST